MRHVLTSPRSIIHFFPFFAFAFFFRLSPQLFVVAQIAKVNLFLYLSCSSVCAVPVRSSIRRAHVLHRLCREAPTLVPGDHVRSSDLISSKMMHHLSLN